MLIRKQAATTAWSERSEKYSRNKEAPWSIMFFNIPDKLSRRLNIFLLSVFLLAWFSVLLLWFPTTNTTTPQPNHINETKSQAHIPMCDGSVSVYVYSLPPEFNVGLLDDCHHLNVYTDMCPHVANCGLGQLLSGMGSGASWFATHQFIAEMIFHARLENHPCRTWDPSRAGLFYIPFYGGLHASSKFREPDLKVRDALAVKLVEFLQAQPWWLKHHGKDHFLALGRTAWDFMRLEEGPDFGANSLLNLSPVQNISVLTVERIPWKSSNQHGIPYPSYFHPSTANEMLTWQNKMRQSERPYLWSFVGAPRKGLEKAAIRDKIIAQCAGSTRCKLVRCGSAQSKCHEPSEVLGVMATSRFCLQAPGDSFTRRSTFDSVLAGCIPVFFSPHTAYTQYAWYLPEDPDAYSVYIDEKGNGSQRIEEELLKIPRERVELMQDRLIEMIPRLTYAHPNASGFGFRDAVDVALAALSKHVLTKTL
ncbi:hypothetical protein I3843_15G087500 [Carya illinoinensis]|uniref:Exostosin GT47 domain-containing protein n=1 Tax=Carya illinoinensis TaxID=32201 RepID=A0A922D212_CARIL|nr:hypothetical protein I3842_15G092900 [Carya illinoinensis]KAG7944192.1 hypothetical protein I3843_15G087500 [Carya illinoinensis]